MGGGGGVAQHNSGYTRKCNVEILVFLQTGSGKVSLEVLV